MGLNSNRALLEGLKSKIPDIEYLPLDTNKALFWVLEGQKRGGNLIARACFGEVLFPFLSPTFNNTPLFKCTNLVVLVAVVLKS